MFFMSYSPLLKLCNNLCDAMQACMYPRLSHAPHGAAGHTLPFPQFRWQQCSIFFAPGVDIGIKSRFFGTK